MKIKIVIILVVCFWLVPVRMSAIDCTTEKYDYYENQLNFINFVLFEENDSISLKIIDDADSLYVLDTKTNIEYGMDDKTSYLVNLAPGEILNFEIISSKMSCLDRVFDTVEIHVPVYNTLHKSSTCENVYGVSYCDKWTYTDYGSIEYEKIVTEYMKKISYENKQSYIIETNWFEDGLYKYYLYFVIPIIIIGPILIIMLKIKEEKNKIIRS